MYHKCRQQTSLLQFLLQRVLPFNICLKKWFNLKDFPEESVRNLTKLTLMSRCSRNNVSLKATETDETSSKNNTERWCQKSITSDTITSNTAPLVHQFLWTFVSKATVGYLSKKRWRFVLAWKPHSNLTAFMELGNKHKCWRKEKNLINITCSEARCVYKSNRKVTSI